MLTRGTSFPGKMTFQSGENKEKAMTRPVSYQHSKHLCVIAAAILVAHTMNFGALGIAAVLVYIPYALSRPAFAIAMVILVLSVMPPVPRSVGWEEIIFCLTFATAIGRWFFPFCKNPRIPATPVTGTSLAFLGLAIASILPASLAGTPMSLWFRGIAPFLTFTIFIPALNDLKTKEARRVIVTALFLSGGMFAVQILMVIPQAWMPASTTSHWIALRAKLPANAFQPAILAAGSFCVGQLALPPSQIHRRYILWFIFLTAAISLTFLRSMILILAILGFLAVMINFYMNPYIIPRVLGKGIKLVAMLAVCFAVSLFIPAVLNFYLLVFKTFTMRFGTGEYSYLESGRYLEWGAILKLAGSTDLWRLVTGWGLGKKITFFHIYLGKELTYGYTHCILSYILLTTGCIGYAFFGALTLSTAALMKHAAFTVPRDELPVFYGFSAALVSMMMYAMLQSVFRHFGFNVLAAVLLASIAQMYTTTFRSPEKESPCAE
ncbi:hypothetical protein [Pseudodesulfovibrio methanolicus]|uniref:O-antigen ligase domain-containing protein n=1 Tax=Pseudodesulfovibrio methanolicus TaxID=3126690 RepID=A0ABZ2IZW6_9BACT